MLSLTSPTSTKIHQTPKRALFRRMTCQSPNFTPSSFLVLCFLSLSRRTGTGALQDLVGLKGQHDCIKASIGCLVRGTRKEAWAEFKQLQIVFVCVWSPPHTCLWMVNPYQSLSSKAAVSRSKALQNHPITQNSSSTVLAQRSSYLGLAAPPQIPNPDTSVAPSANSGRYRSCPAFASARLQVTFHCCVLRRRPKTCAVRSTLSRGIVLRNSGICTNK